MCILSYLPPGADVDKDGLHNGGISNPHGHGWAIATADVIIAGKSLDLEQALDEFIAARKRHQAGPALFHSRWATHGSVSIANTHPFLVGGSHKTVVAHNGILPESAHPAEDDDRSATRKFADEIQPTRFRRLDRSNVTDALSQWCGTHNKLVILTADPRYQHTAYIINEAAGQWDTETGLWHSNGDYLDYHPRLGSAGSRLFDESGYLDVCYVCEYGLVDNNGYCDECRACQDCMEHVRYCMCWSRPGRAATMHLWEPTTL